MKTTFWVNSCLHVSLCAGFLTYASASFLNSDSSLFFGLFALLGTWTVYVAQRIFKRQRRGITQVHQHILDHKKIYLPISIAAGVAAAILAAIKGTEIMMLAALGFIASVMYVYLPGKNKSLRSFPISKIVLVGLTWAIVTLAIPALDAGSSFSDSSFQLMFLERLIFVILITLPFDIRDLLRDGLKEKTLPMVLGEGGTRILMVVLTAFLLFTCWYQVDTFYYSESQAIALAVVYVLSLVAGLIAKSSLPEFYFTFWVESLLLLNGLALLVENFF